MKKLFLILTLAASLITTSAADFSAVHASMTWTPMHSITNHTGQVRQARTAPASKEFWKAWRADKTALRKAGYSARPTDNGREVSHDSPAPQVGPHQPQLRSRNPQPLTPMTIAAKAFSNTGPWRGVYFDGPQSDQNHEGDEIPVWLVYVGNEETEPTDTVYKCHNFQSAEQLAERMAHDRRLDLIHEACPA